MILRWFRFGILVNLLVVSGFVRLVGLWFAFGFAIVLYCLRLLVFG